MNTFLNYSNAFYDTVRLFVPNHSKISDIVEKRPDPQSVGQWEKHVFVPEQSSPEPVINNINYFVFTPEATEQKPDTEGMPLVVMLHGCRQTASAFAHGTKMNVLAQSHGFVTLYPQQSLRNSVLRCWRWFDRGDFSGMAEMRTLMEMIHTVITDYKLDNRKVFLVGLSAGAGMASLLAANHPDEFCALALHSGPVLNKAHNITSGLQVMADRELDSDACLLHYLNGFEPKSFYMPAMIIQGINDMTVNKSNATELAKQFLHLNNLPMDLETSYEFLDTGTSREYRHASFYDQGHTVVETIEACSLEHAWGGGDAALPYNSDDGPDSSALIVDFFERCSKEYDARHQA